MNPEERSHRIREAAWKAQGIMFLGKPLTWKVYEIVRNWQGDKCAICDRNFLLGLRRIEGADHDHKTHEFRGVLCNGRKSCNLSLVGRYEQNPRSPAINLLARTLIAAYLQDPPAREAFHHGAL